MIGDMKVSYNLKYRPSNIPVPASDDFVRLFTCAMDRRFKLT
jgi:hypothetical protein